MKQLILLIFITISGMRLHAQDKTYRYRDLEFNRNILFSEKKWVVVYNPDSTSFYSFGYSYFDPDKGFTFQKIGSFKISNKNKYLLNPADAESRFEPQHILRVTSWMISKSIFLLGAVLPLQHYKELGISTVEPGWVKPYYTYTDTLAYKYKKGSVYIDTDYLQDGARCMEEIYKIDPHYPGLKLGAEEWHALFDYKGVELKLAYAYERLQQFDKGIAIMLNAINYNPKNVSFYRELGSLYSQKKELSKAIDAYKHGIDLIPDEKSYHKYWFAGCISNMYEELKNDKERIKWRALSDGYNPHPGLAID